MIKEMQNLLHAIADAVQEVEDGNRSAIEVASMVNTLGKELEAVTEQLKPQLAHSAEVGEVWNGITVVQKSRTNYKYDMPEEIKRMQASIKSWQNAAKRMAKGDTSVTAVIDQDGQVVGVNPARIEYSNYVQLQFPK